MRTLFLTLVLGVAALGVVGTPVQAGDGHDRGGHYGYYRDGGRGWRGGSHWRGGSSWRGGSNYGYRGYSGGYYGPAYGGYGYNGYGGYGYASPGYNGYGGYGGDYGYAPRYYGGPSSGYCR